jgi:hypothetical protein
MHVIEKAAHWVFAAFMAAVAWFVCMVLGAFLTVKLMGLQVGVQPPVGFQPQIGTAGMTVLFGIILFAPLTVATFVGAMTAPFAQRGIAAIVFPVLVLAAVILMTYAGPQHHGPDFVMLLEMATSCAVPGGLVYIRRRRQQSRIAEF